MSDELVGSSSLRERIHVTMEIWVLIYIQGGSEISVGMGRGKGKSLLYEGVVVWIKGKGRGNEKKKNMEKNMEMVMLRSSDGQDFKVEKGAAMMSQVIKDLLHTAAVNDNSTTTSSSGPGVVAAGKPLVLHNVKGHILDKLLQYCQYHFLTTAARAANPSPPSSSAAVLSSPTTAVAAPGGPVSGAQSSAAAAAAPEMEGSSSSTTSAAPALAAASAIGSSSSSSPAAAVTVGDAHRHPPAAVSRNLQLVDHLRQRDKSFIQSLNNDALFELTMAANYLNIPSLLELCCQAVADMIDSKSADDIRRIFHIENDFTPEEEETMKKELRWAYGD